MIDLWTLPTEPGAYVFAGVVIGLLWAWFYRMVKP